MKFDPTKLIVLVTCIVAVTLLMALRVVEPVAGMPIVTAAAFYAIGNGRAVMKGERPGTLLTRTDVRTRADDTQPIPPPNGGA